MTRRKWDENVPKAVRCVFDLRRFLIPGEVYHVKEFRFDQKSVIEKAGLNRDGIVFTFEECPAIEFRFLRCQFKAVEERVNTKQTTKKTKVSKRTTPKSF